MSAKAQAQEREDFEAACSRIERRRAAAPAPALVASAPAEVALHKPEVFAPDPPGCPDCHGRGFKLVPDGGAGTAERCPCQDPDYDGPESVPAADLEVYGAPVDVSGLLKATWDTNLGAWPPELDAWPADMADEAGARPRFLMLWGGTGNGKSRGAAWAMRRAMANGRSCWWVDVPAAVQTRLDLIGGTDDELRSWKTRTAAWMKRYLVVLDDIGATQETDYQEQLVWGWVRARYQSGLYTLGTTNLSPAEMRSRFPAFASRLLSGPVVEMTGLDGRRKEWRIR